MTTMLNILKIEWLKLRRYRAFVVLSILTLIGIPGASYIIYSMTGIFRSAVSVGPGAAAAIGNAVIGSPFAFPEVFITVPYVSGFMLILPGLLMILLITNEYNFRTNRQNVIDGMTRDQFIAGKMLLALIIGVAVTAAVFLTALLFGVSGDAPLSFKNIRHIGYFFVQSIAYMSVAMVIAMIVKRAGIGTVIFFVYAIVAENVVALIIDLNVSHTVAYLLPLKSADKLIPAPTLMGKMLTRQLPDPMWLLAAAAGWIALFMWFCRHRFGRSDL